MKLLSLFSGIGAFEKALVLNNMDYELVNYCEIDKYAAKAYSIIHNVSEDLNLKDIRTVDTSTLKDIDLITYGFPCVDISRAGKQKGFVDDNGNVTRSGLFFEALRIIIDTQPKVAIAENVKALTTKKFADEFGIVLHGLDNAGYNNYWAVLNAKDYGIPQNRERVFIISIRKDVDNGTFAFPKPIPLTTRLKDVLETNVDEKFYLLDAQIHSIKTNTFVQATRRIQDKDYCDTILARDYKDPKCVMVDTDTAKVMQIGNIKPKNSWDNPQYGRVYDSNGISPALLTMQGGNRQPKIVEHKQDFRIRKLTPLECWRLMGFTDEDCNKVKAAGISNSQLYKMAGNSICVSVLQAIFRQLKDIL